MEASVGPLPTSNPVFDGGSREMQHGRLLLLRNAPQKFISWQERVPLSGQWCLRGKSVQPGGVRGSAVQELRPRIKPLALQRVRVRGATAGYVFVASGLQIQDATVIFAVHSANRAIWFDELRSTLSQLPPCPEGVRFRPPLICAQPVRPGRTARRAASAGN
jgi:hypothetical protein